MVARKILVVAGIALAWLAWTSEASAQYTPYSPVTGAGLSPYMGLIGGNYRGGLTQRYLNVVQPQLQARQAFQAQGAQIQALHDQVRTAEDRMNQGAATTGHPAMFMNYSHYFGNSSSGAQVGRKLPKPSMTTAYRR